MSNLNGKSSEHEKKSEQSDESWKAPGQILTLPRRRKGPVLVILEIMLVTSLGIAGCMARSGKQTNPNQPAPTHTPAEATQSPIQTGPIQIRWSVGIGMGADPAQAAIENEVVADFNTSQNTIQLIIEVVPKASAEDVLSTEIAAGVGPDIVGPVSWLEANAFDGQWLDLAPYLGSNNLDTSKYEPALPRMYETDQGTVGLPFDVYPSAIYYNTGLFTAAGLNPPPARYGDQYMMPDGTLVDWNWDTLSKVAKLLTRDSDGRHSGEAGFNADAIVQYGFSFGWEIHPSYWAAYMSNGGQMLMPGGSRGNYIARIPDAWKTAWKWVYDGTWGPEPYIPNAAASAGPDLDNGNTFASGRVAMTESPSWYLCCLSDLTKTGGQFEFGAMPIGLDGKVAGHLEEDTFRIWKGSQHTAEAFTFLAYLINSGIQKLVVGTPAQAPAYVAIPAPIHLRGAWLAAQKTAFPYIRNWDTLMAGLNYPDIPSAEAFMPNMNDAWTRLQTFGDLLANNSEVDLAAQEDTLESDLTTIFNK